MVTFTVGHEVLYGGRRYVITSLQSREPYTVRLLATTPDGPEVRFVRVGDLEKISSYTEPRHDTASA